MGAYRHLQDTPLEELAYRLGKMEEEVRELRNFKNTMYTKQGIDVLPKGQVFRGTNENSITGVGGTSVNVVTGSFMAFEGRKYLIQAHSRYNGDNGAGSFLRFEAGFNGADNSTRALFAMQTQSTGASNWQSCNILGNNAFVPSSTGMQAVYLTINRESGSNTVRTAASSAAPSVLRVFDMGAA